MRKILNWFRVPTPPKPELDAAIEAAVRRKRENRKSPQTVSAS